MTAQPSISYFLGANTADGFISVYEDLAKYETVQRIWYIKGGPGNGKSTFMRNIAAAAETAGSHTEYILCSGDPDSLDGIVIRELKTAYVDATSPHVQEPALPGVSGKYLDLSQFYKRTAVFDRDRIEDLFREYREQYHRSYGFFDAARTTGAAYIQAMISESEGEKLQEVGSETAAKLVSEGSGHVLVRRFISANTCRGFLSLPESAIENGKVYLLQGKDGLARYWLKGAAEVCRQRRQKMILCLDPTDSRIPEGLILPEAGISFLTARKGVRYHGTRREVSRLLGGAEDASDESKRMNCIRKELIKQAEECLKKAKLAHDALEGCYSRSVDFRALDRFTARHIEREIKR